MLKRSEQRFPCVGIELMFSPIKDDCIEDLGSEIYSAVGHDMSFSGLSFDIRNPMNIGDQIYIIVSNQFQPPERLTADVCWCKTLDNGNYRIGVHIIASAGVALDTENRTEDYISAEESLGPSEATLICPSCLEVSTFSFINNQEGDWGKGIMPLYQCSECETTRSIPNILEFNRHHRINELKSTKTIFHDKQLTSRSTNELKRILYIEDEPDIRTVAQMALEMVGGFTVEVCHSGFDALEKADSFMPDLILLDVMMPELTGPETLERLRERAQFSETPAIYMTAKIQTHEVYEYKTSFVLGVIPKPFDPMSLSEELLTLWKGEKN